MKLGLGTVQFGLPYGVANTSGQVGRATATAILHCAQSEGLDTLDTAIAYGESEQLLGDIGIDGWQVVTKLPEVPKGCTNVTAWVKDQVQGSLSRLKKTHLAGLLLHCPRQLLGMKGENLWATLLSLKHDGIVEKIGLSIYDTAELDSLMPSFSPDLVQAPYNILDRRLITSGWLQRMSDSGVEIHVRSVFLQGLLLMSESDRPRKFDRWSTIWTAWDYWLGQNGVTALEGCLAFAMKDPRISRVIVGVDSLHQLKQVINSTGINISEFPHELNTNDLDLITPSRWNSL